MFTGGFQRNTEHANTEVATGWQNQKTGVVCAFSICSLVNDAEIILTQKGESTVCLGK